MAIAVFIIATLGIVFFSVNQDYQLVAPDHYKQATEYQERIDGKQRAAAAHQVPVITKKSGTLSIQWPENPGLIKPKGSIYFYRPDNTLLDRTLPISVDSLNSFHVKMADFQSGKWTLNIDWTLGGEAFFHSQNVFF